MTKKNLFNIIFYLFIFLLVVYFMINIVQSLLFTDSFILKTVDEYTYNEFVEISGMAVRTETLVNSNEKYDFINYTVNDGERVAKDSIIAYYNTAPLNSEKRVESEKLNRKINQLENSVNDRVQYDVITLDKQIKTEINNFLFEAGKEDFDKIIEKIDDIQILFNKKDIKISGSDYYVSVLAQANDQKDQILVANNTIEEYVRSPLAGYLLSSYDGYEYLNASDYSEITVSQYNELMAKTAQPMQAYFVGKLQSIPNWYYISLLDTSDVKDLYVGKKVSIEFDLPYAGSKILTAYIEYISRNQDGKTVVNFRCETLNSDIFKLRRETANLIITSYSGLKISNDALRVNEGQDGVYVLSAQQIIFKPIKIIYSASDFSI